MATKTIHVTKPFNLTHKQGHEVKKTPFLPGVQEIDEELAEHWYVKAHSTDLPKKASSGDTGKPDGGKKA